MVDQTVQSAHWHNCPSWSFLRALLRKWDIKTVNCWNLMVWKIAGRKLTSEMTDCDSTPDWLDSDWDCDWLKASLLKANENLLMAENAENQLRAVVTKRPSWLVPDLLPRWLVVTQVKFKFQPIIFSYYFCQPMKFFVSEIICNLFNDAIRKQELFVWLLLFRDSAL